MSEGSLKERPHVSKEHAKFKTTVTKVDNMTTALKQASTSPYAIFIYIPALPPSPPPYWAAANFQNPHSCTFSDSSILHIKHWTCFLWPADLPSQNECVLHTTWQWFKPNTNSMFFFLFPQSRLVFPLTCGSFSTEQGFHRSSHAAWAFSFHDTSRPH